MTNIEGFRLELVRPGPLHGQLLSKLTNYLALCDGVEADTFRLPFDHHEITSDLQALRYYVGRLDHRLVPNELRAAAVDRLSNRITEALAQMRGLQTRLAKAIDADLTHLRLILGGGELSLVPFELASIPSGWVGSGEKLSLQSKAPVVVTRELRDSGLVPVAWDRRPRILFCTSNPDGFSPPPRDAHLLALLRALRPWVHGGREHGQWLRPEDVVTVLTDASIESITAETRRQEYTHIHLVCHGCPVPNDEGRFGIALAKQNSPRSLDAVNASTLANALWNRERGQQPPTMVVLAACDSANQSVVESPGSSFAYELHRAGVPWVVASQLPLTYRGSALFAERFYQGVFEGRDPRFVLNDVRSELARDPAAHDWASVVAYASFPKNFDDQVRSFRIKQLRRFIDSALDRIRGGKSTPEVEFPAIDECLRKWELVLPRDSGRKGAAWAEYMGMRGAITKQRSALLSDPTELRSQLEIAAGFYRQAMRAEISNHWGLVQYLSLATLLNLEIDQGWFALAEHAAHMEWEDSKRASVWAVASLLELAVLHQRDSVLGRSCVQWAELLKSMVNRSDFALFATRRQLHRYFGQFAVFERAEIQKRAKRAYDLLPPSAWEPEVEKDRRPAAE